ncbi:MAG: TIGR00725 family protein [candidate division WOR-3 bacterium]
MNKKIIAVIGGAETSEKNLRIAEEVGALIAENGAILITGGLGGVMEAASRGAKKAGGLVIGILPGTDKRTANEYVDIPIVTGMNQARNIIIARTCDCAIAIDGKYGTLTEIAYCLMFNVPVIGINTWKIDAPIIHVKTAKQAVEKAFELTEG